MRIKKILAILSAFLILCGTLWAFEPQEFMDYTATQTADAAAVVGAGYLYGISCKTDGTNAVTFQIYDNATEASGTRIVQDYICATSSANRVCVFGWDPPIPFTNGVFVDITSTDTDPDYVVYYRLR